ncbi:hypothetical protein BT96DRAFT_763444, partial [Gymnopus androsaceus JB14]
DALLLNKFREHYHHFESAVTQVRSQETDVFLLEVLGEDVNDFSAVVNEYSHVFPDQSEWQTLRTNLQLMLLDIRSLHGESTERSQQGRPTIVHQERTGRPGRPRTVINRDFLNWAYTQRTTSGIGHFLGLSRNTVRRSLLEYGFAPSGANPFPSNTSTTSSSGYLSNMSDEDLDGIICLLRSHYPRAGIRILDDGYSRTITGMRASDNNHSPTVLSLFLSA